ncbi:sulfatase [Candidatus Hydrogenedentota bacterium]
MNFIVIMSDTFRRDHLGAYGNNWIHTPALNKFAKEATVFDRYYTASFPTLPNRSDLFTGQYTFLTRSWDSFPRKVPHLPIYFYHEGYVTQLIHDTPHLENEGNHYDRGWMGWEWVRGQEIDRAPTIANVEIEYPAAREKLRFDAQITDQELRNVYFRQFESDWTTAQVVDKACKWLEYNYKADNFLLWLDIFDPHESFMAPEYFTERYYPGYKGDKIITPHYGPVGDVTKSELKYIQAAYAGEVTFVDKYIGWLLRKVEDLQLMDDTTIIFMTDHGFYLGDHGLLGKSNRTGPFPFFEQITHIPMMIKTPGKRMKKRCSAVIQPPDILPTMLDLAGAKMPEGLHGRSFKAVLEGKSYSGRNIAPMSHGIYDDMHALERRHTISTKTHAVLIGPDGAKPELYDLRTDPEQRKNVFKKQKDVAKRICGQFRKFLREHDAYHERVEKILV